MSVARWAACFYFCIVKISLVTFGAYLAQCVRNYNFKLISVLFIHRTVK